MKYNQNLKKVKNHWSLPNNTPTAAGTSDSIDPFPPASVKNNTL
jgi:hypothetical protein